MYIGGDFADFVSIYFGFDGCACGNFEADELRSALPTDVQIGDGSGVIRFPIGLRLTAFRAGDWRPYVAFEFSIAVGGGVTVRSPGYDGEDPASYEITADLAGPRYSPAIGARYTLFRLTRGRTVDLGLELRTDITPVGEDPVSIDYVASEPSADVAAAANAVATALEAHVRSRGQFVSGHLRFYLSARF